MAAVVTKYVVAAKSTTGGVSGYVLFNESISLTIVSKAKATVFTSKMLATGWLATAKQLNKKYSYAIETT